MCLEHPTDVTAGRPRSGRALEHITLQAVEINGDLSVATVWWRLKDEGADGHTGGGSLAELDAQRQEANRAIKSSISWMRRRVGVALSLRKVPVLRFRHADIASSEERASGGRAHRRKPQQPKQQRAQRLADAFAAIASERTQDGG